MNRMVGAGGCVVEVPERLVGRLRTLALDEPWSFRESNGTDLLVRYLRYTFVRLEEEGKVVHAQDEQGEFSVLNTGLFDSSFEDIFCVATKAPEKDGQHWETKAFCTWGRSRFGKRLARALGDGKPVRARYFRSLADSLVDLERSIEPDYDKLREQGQKIDADLLRALDTDDESFETALRVAVDLAYVRLRCMPTSVLPAWGVPVGIKGAFYCLPLSFLDPLRVDAVLALEPPAKSRDLSLPYTAHTLLSLEEAYIAARLVRRLDAGAGWLAEAAHTRIGTKPVVSRVSKLDGSGTGTPRSVRDSASDVSRNLRARLTCRDSAIPAYILRPGDTVGVLRRQSGERPNVVLPLRRGFDGVSQIQGRFKVDDNGRWEFLHEGSNWTMIRHRDGHQVVLRERGARERMSVGDGIVFSGSPPFVFGR